MGKKYIIGHQAENGRYMALRDVLMQNVRSFWYKTKDLVRGRPIIKGDTQEEVWALKDVSFEIRQGEVVGIIGRNGAGKSTLLKVLSRITEPSAGRVTIKGRLASLLEVGTGFHPELTGRENIYLNGAILGMTRQDSKRKFDEIVAFAEVEKFLDTPVKRYSSGMYVRLAFAVAAHLEPEILLVDEVLAVGDAAFQKKCLGKMGDVAKEGRTVLFVSHNMGMITSLCPKAILLESGRLVTQGPASETVLNYYNRGRFSPHAMDDTRDGRKVGDHLATLLEAWVEDMDGNPTSEVDIRYPFKIKMRYALHEKVPKPPYPNFHFFDARGEYAFVTSGNKFASSGTDVGTYVAECIVPGHLLNNGTYFIGLAVTFTHQGIHVSFYEKDALSVNVRDLIDETLDDIRSGYSGPIPGPVRPKLEWRIKKVS
nr:ABC transporter ATP-binding protein [Desulfovulcanus ferrireducens]